MIASSIRFLDPKTLSSSRPTTSDAPAAVNDEPPAGYVKSILPCTPLAIVKCLEYTGVYNKILPYGDRAYGKTVTVINRQVYAAVYPDDAADAYSCAGRKLLAARLLRSWQTTVLVSSQSTSILFKSVPFVSSRLHEC